jgi:hypothetical protein
MGFKTGSGKMSEGSNGTNKRIIINTRQEKGIKK